MSPQTREKTTETALAVLFASNARAAVLRLFMIDPTRAYYQRQIEAATGLPIRAVQRELERLQSIDLLYRHSEGNRTYYQVDMQFALFPELRSMILKASAPLDKLRGLVALEPSILIAVLSEENDRVLAVVVGSAKPNLQPPPPFSIEVMTREDFAEALAERAPAIHDYLERGVDLLGKRDDVIWRRIEAAGYSVQKGKGVA